MTAIFIHDVWTFQHRFNQLPRMADTRTSHPSPESPMPVQTRVISFRAGEFNSCVDWLKSAALVSGSEAEWVSRTFRLMHPW